MNYRKIGGIRFLTIGRLQVSFCVKRKRPKVISTKIPDDVIRASMVSGLEKILAKEHGHDCR